MEQWMINFIKDKWRRFKNWIIGLFTVGVALAAVAVPVIDNQIDPFENLPDRFEFVMDQTLPEAGESRVRISKNAPEVIFGRWDDEIQMKVSYNKISAQGNRPLFSNRVEWKGAKEEVHAYPLDPAEGMEGGGFEMEVILQEKPDTNVFEFQIEGAENLDFFYQSQEYCDGVDTICADNVVGSYAVYHKTKNNRCLGSNCKQGNLNYGNGKFQQIFRPELTDGDGNKSWGILSYIPGLLSVAIPLDIYNEPTTEWLNFKIDPTFGFTSLGSSNFFLCRESGNNSRRLGTLFTTTEDGTLDKLSVGLKVSADTETVDSTAYINIVNDPDTLSFAETAKSETTDLLLTTTATFYDFTTASESITGSQDYVLSGACDGNDIAATNVDGTISTDTNSVDHHYGDGSYTYSSFEDPWTPNSHVQSPNADKFSVFATYTATGGGARVIIIN